MSSLVRLYSPDLTLDSIFTILSVNGGGDGSPSWGTVAFCSSVILGREPYSSTNPSLLPDACAISLSFSFSAFFLAFCLAFFSFCLNLRFISLGDGGTDEAFSFSPLSGLEPSNSLESPGFWLTVAIASSRG